MPLLNFRDPALTADSHRNRICPGILFRSAQPFPAADQDTVRELLARDIRTIVDLRGGAERSAADWAAAEEAGIRVRWAPLDATAEMATIDPRSLRTADDLGRFYLTLAESTPGAIADAVTAATAPGAALVHCAAGKDRTGLVVALLLDLAGVPADGIADDYARTAEALPRIFSALAGAAGLGALNTKDPAANTGSATAHGGQEIPPALLEAPAGAIRAFMDGIRTRHGGTEKFLHGCGVDPAAIASFRTKAAQARESVPAAPSGL
ncbi:tyrosine-protein phosphatase [Streptomyces sp. NBC_01243]|uniref:tyrosine-protein phosphatase n=1 Tax=Streptomyces sp. NBC_01243 TaxID=2903796 RepID=UPI002E127786|nr:tyrosine-protein phosphatase [Streptomyces sp. NBC_01243]